MMSSYVCRRCRLRLNRIPNLRNPQLQHRATFVSVRRVGVESPEESQDANQANETTPPRASRSPANRGRGNIGDSWRSERSGRYSRYAQEGEDHRPERTAAPTNSEPLTSGQETGGVNESDVLHIRRSSTKGDLMRAWEQFLDTYPSRDCRPLAEPRLTDVNLLAGGKVFKRLLNQVIESFSAGSTISVTPTQAVFRYEQLGIRERFQHYGVDESGGRRAHYGSIGNMWRDTIGSLTENVLKQLSQPSDQLQSVEILLSELLSVWKLFFQLKGPGDLNLETIDTRWKLPSPDTLPLSMHDPSAPRDLLQRMEVYHLKAPSSPTLGFSAAVIFTLLKENSPFDAPFSDALRAQAAPFMELLVHISPGARMAPIFKHLDVSQTFRQLPENFRRQIEDQIKIAPADALNIVGPQTSRKTASPAAVEESTPSDAITDEVLVEDVMAPSKRAGAKPAGPGDANAHEEFMLKRIERASVETKRVDQLQALWTTILRDYTIKGKVQIPLVIYNALVTGYLLLHAPDRTLEVWNHMVRNGVQPDVTTWTAMLTGCDKARDLKGLDGTWKRMIQSGVQPDVHAWTTRIHGLISLHKINEGLTAMDEMGKRYLAAERTSQSLAKGSRNTKTKSVPNNLPKPTIDVVNGAASAFNELKRSLPFPQKLANINKVLGWASHFDIQPNAQTFNIMLQLHISANDHAAVNRLLAQMQREGIEADLATWTMLIRASFSTITSLSHDQQTEHIVSLLNDLEADGFKLNAYVYSSCVDQLIKQSPPNFAGVQALVAHMHARNLVPSPHMYTTLITHYFAQTPPDIEAVNALYARITSTPGTPTDQRMYERLITGFAQANEIGSTMAVLNRMSKQGLLPSWGTLGEVLEMLVRAGEWERARDLVNDVQAQKGVAKNGVMGGRGRGQNFMDRARVLGLVDEQGMGMRRPGPMNLNQSQGQGHQQGQDGGDSGLGQTISEGNVQYEGLTPEEQWAEEDLEGENGSVGGVPL